jgi:phosphatidylserine synthase
MQVWAVYVLVVGLGLLVVPNVVLGLVGIPETTEVWVRVVGVLALALDVLFWSMVQRRDVESIRATVYERWLVATLLTLLAFTTGPWQLVLFAALDFLGATWTYLALRADLESAAASS